ncbi:grasp-with-spasm system SPASM domain peptide maturase [Tenacibaculum xiamenense]|uniref:grasp-with-spasm system SPASM domain peptide maturase n=1 Tax=Tenacibaculum xiamenense TaxID=1261553 RepID=UPI00389359E3
MKKSEEIFHLYSCCLTFQGHRRSVIIDTQRNELYYIPNALYSLLKNNPTKLTVSNDEMIKEYLSFLLDNEIGFLLEKNDNFPSLSLNFHTPFKITNATIEIENFSNYNLSKVSDELIELGCKSFYLKIIKNCTINDLIKIFSHFKENAFNSIDILTSGKLINVDQLIEFILVNPNIRNFTLTDSNKNDLIQLSGDGMTTLRLTTDGVNKMKKITPKMFNLNLQFISESFHYNNYLNKKITVDRNGLIKNSCSFDQSFGHIDKVSLKDVISNSEFSKFWELNNDKVEICKDCEHRYICPQIVKKESEVYKKPEICSYNPYIGEWE